MALGDNPFVGLSMTDLNDLRTAYVQVIKDVAGGGQSYAVSGRTFTRATLPEARTTLKQINDAIAYARGDLKTSAQSGIAGPVIDPSTY